MMRHFLLTIMMVLAALTVTAQSNRIFIEDFVVDRDSVVSAPVELVNETPMRGLQFKMTLPEGLKIESSHLTNYSEKYEMNLVCRQTDNGDYAVFIYPLGRVCYPADSVAIMMLDFAAGPDFKGGDIILSNAKGSTIDNKSITIDGDTTTVTVPASSLIGIPIDQTQGNGKFF